MSRPRKIDGYESAKRAEYRGQPHTQLIAVGDNLDALIEAKENAERRAEVESWTRWATESDEEINRAIADAFLESVDLQINQELRELIHQDKGTFPVPRVWNQINQS